MKEKLRYLLLADIHGNLEALKTVLMDALKFKYKRIIVLGDIIGYYTKPNECLQLLNKKQNALLMGNHEAAINEMLSLDDFNEEARISLEWTKKNLTKENLELIKAMPKFFALDLMLAIHGTPMNPLEEYMNEMNALLSLKICSEQLIVCGHTHKPFIVNEKGEKTEIKGNQKIDFKTKRIVASLPSVGQPRDEDNRAGYCILDLNEFELHFRRIQYNIKATTEDAKKNGIPKPLIERLYKGI